MNHKYIIAGLLIIAGSLMAFQVYKIRQRRAIEHHASHDAHDHDCCGCH
jgi:hypothetical protein